MTTLDDDQHIDPWTVKGGKKGFDYLKLLNQFGTHPISPDIIKRIERLTNMRVHRFLRRGIFFSQQYLEQFLDHYEKGKLVYIYTGRGASSNALHIGHIVPFELTAWLQKAFGCIVVIQMSDDEKFYFKGGILDDYNKMARLNAYDIIACGFNPKKTYIFSNYEEIARGNPGLWRNIVLMNNFTAVNQVRSIFGLNQMSIIKDENGNDKPSAVPCSVGMMSWPIFQSVPAISSSFKFIFGDEPAHVIIPMAIDQSPYFRLANDYSTSAKLLKSCCLHSEFLISLAGPHLKMGANEVSAPIFLTDTEQEARKKLKKAVSGGRDTKEIHLLLGADLIVDVSYQWLVFLLDDDNELEKIAQNYGPPKNDNVRMMASDVKKILGDVVVAYLIEHQRKRSLITDEVIADFFNPHKEFDLSRPVRETIELLSDEEYEKQGAGFDRYFNLY